MVRFPEEQLKTVQGGIAYRVECLNPDNKWVNQTLIEGGFGGMKPRAEDLIDGSWEKTFKVHLTWFRRPSPFTSFFDSWKRAMGWLKTMLDNGADEVVVVAVWLGGLPCVYDGSEIAKRLCKTAVTSKERRKLEMSHGELLVRGPIPAEEDRILARFSGENWRMQRLALRFPFESPLVSQQMLTADPRNGPGQHKEGVMWWAAKLIKEAITAWHKA